jgi:hypothetical protein
MNNGEKKKDSFKFLGELYVVIKPIRIDFHGKFQTRYIALNAEKRFSVGGNVAFYSVPTL